MGITLLHGSMEWVAFGLIMALSIVAFLWRWNRRQYGHAIGMVGMYMFLLTLHRSHSMLISMAMALAVLLVDFIALPVLRWSRKP